MVDESALAQELGRFLSGRWGVLGIGNVLRSDDAFGSAVARRLLELFRDAPASSFIFDGGVAPENFVGKIARARIENLLVVDSVMFGGRYGELRLFDVEELFAPFVLTHGPSNFELLARALPETRIKVLASHPRNTRLGTKMSPQVLEAVERAVRLIAEAAGGQKR